MTQEQGHRPTQGSLVLDLSELDVNCSEQVRVVPPPWTEGSGRGGPYPTTPESTFGRTGVDFTRRVSLFRSLSECTGTGGRVSVRCRSSGLQFPGRFVGPVRSSEDRRRFNTCIVREVLRKNLTSVLSSLEKRVEVGI